MSYKFKILIEKTEYREVEVVAEDLDTAIALAKTPTFFSAAKPEYYQSVHKYVTKNGQEKL